MPSTFCLFLHFLSHHQFIKQFLLKFVEIGKRKKTEQLKLLNQLLTYSVIQKTILDIYKNNQYITPYKKNCLF